MATIDVADHFPFALSELDLHRLQFARFYTETSDRYVAHFGHGDAEIFQGDDLAYDKDGNLTGGTITSIQIQHHGDIDATMNGLAISAVALQDASETFRFSDDRQLFATAFHGDDTLNGGSAGDLLQGFAGNDTLAGHGGADLLEGGNGKDTLAGGTGDDLLIGGNGRDTLSGGNDADHLFGGAGADMLDGGRGNDHLSGGSGNDVLDGGLGDNVLHGGSGADTFVFDIGVGAASDNLIPDFSLRQGDMLELKTGAGVAPLPTVAGGTLDPTAFHIGAHATDADQRVIYNAHTGSLSFDGDGSGSEAAIQIGMLDSHLHLTAADFLVA
ncbi:MAG TPA: calcium-binding protein [Hyphomicrobiales bacterium]|nr:calcium-binding protein [Hyphomicrobiales bacterium]